MPSIILNNEQETIAKVPSTTVHAPKHYLSNYKSCPEKKCTQIHSYDPKTCIIYLNEFRLKYKQY